MIHKEKTARSSCGLARVQTGVNRVERSIVSDGSTERGKRSVVLTETDQHGVWSEMAKSPIPELCPIGKMRVRMEVKHVG